MSISAYHNLINTVKSESGYPVVQLSGWLVVRQRTKKPDSRKTEKLENPPRWRVARKVVFSSGNVVKQEGFFVLKRLQLLPVLVALAVVVTCMVSWATDTEQGTPTPTPAASPSPAEEPASPTPPLPTPFRADFVEYVSFGYWSDEPFDSDWNETREVPFRAGRYFGWRLRLREPHPPFVKIIERLTLPGAPATWGGLEERHLVTNDRRTATKPTDLKVRDHWIHRANWQLSPGDALGRHVIEIEVEGRLAARIAFDIVEERPAPNARTPDQNEDIEDEVPDDTATPGGGDDLEPNRPSPPQNNETPARTPVETMR